MPLRSNIPSLNPPRKAGAVQPQDTSHNHEVLMAMAVYSLDLIAYINLDETYREVNQTWLDYWGCTRADVVGMSVRDRLGPQAYERDVADVIKEACAGQLVRFQHMVNFQARGPRFMEIALIPDKDAQGQVRGVVLRSHDIHDQHEREVLLEETLATLEQRTLEQQRFIQVISHDLREPVNAVRNFASLLATDHEQDLPPPARRYLGYVCEGGERMKQMLDDLTDLLQLDVYELHRETVDIAAMVNDVTRELSPSIERTRAELSSDATGELIADPSLIRIVLMAYIGNALKFTRPGQPPRIHIALSPVPGGTELSVADEGLGIPAQKQPALFDMFRRLHTRQRFDGAGLGLSICRRIALLHGGRVTLQSQPGQGSRFGIVIPFATVLPTP